MSSPATIAEPDQEAQWRYGTRTFWIPHILAWSLLHALLFIPVHTLARMMGAKTIHVVMHSAVGALAAIAVSSLMGWAYMRLPNHYVEGVRAIGTVAVASLTGSMLWFAMEVVFRATAGFGPWVPTPVMVVPYALPVFMMMRGAMALGTWSAMFLVVLLGRRARIAREREAVASSLMHEAQLKLLRSQLNPHFLFNALNSIVGMIGSEPDLARQMTRDVATMLRRGLGAPHNKSATVADELEFIELYLRCEQARFEDRLVVAYKVPDELLSLPLPGMLLHPLVENAVKHGMCRTAPLELEIGGRLEGRSVVLEVRNTGALGATQRTPQPGTGTGLRSVQQRIRALFDDGELSLSEREGWVTARIHYTPSEAAG